jgi:CO/xanthine dehydrogenase Mo-binding subunit
VRNGFGSGRNSIPWYRTGPVEVVSRLLQTMPLRTSAMRALGAHLNVYAIEQVIDELAAEAGADPVAFRLSLMADERARAVVEAAARAAGWGGARPPGTTGRGIGCARYKHVGAYCAVVAEVEAETEVRVTRLTIAADVGAPVNPDGVISQLEGGALQAVSWTVKERVGFDRVRVTSRTWEDYPILTFSEVPAVEVVLVGDTGAASLGAGEASVGPTAAAIGNAVAAALGLRVRNLPLTAANVVAAMG